MSTPQEFNISFQHQNVNYNLNLVKGLNSDQTVLINGVSYAILGNEEKVESAQKILSSVPLDSILSSEDLALKLSVCKDISSISTNKTDSIGVNTLNTQIASKPQDELELLNYGTWMIEEKSTLHDRQKKVASAYFSNFIFKDTEKDHSGLIGFLKCLPECLEKLEEIFIETVKTKDFDLFMSLFKHLTTDNLYSINNGEQLNAMPVIPEVLISDRPVKITSSFVEEIRDFMRDSNFSGVVALTDGDKAYTITVDKLNEPNAPFAMHSIGKMFTGALMLRLIEEGKIPKKALNEPIQLDDEVIEMLPPAIRKQLNETTLHQVMIHQGRYGNYLEKYQNEIEKALEENASIPQVNEPKDFLVYADRELVPFEELEPIEKDGPKVYKYSNLGILLVGLAIEHLYNKNSIEKLPYSEILRQYVIEPAGIQTFAVQAPPGARVNIEDRLASHISGGPAGGYWSTTEDLLKFGKWLGDKSKEEFFMQLLNSYGREFYKDEQKDISHGGSIESASAHLSHRIDYGITLAVMSDMTGLGKASEFAQIVQKHFKSLSA